MTHLEKSLTVNLISPSATQEKIHVALAMLIKQKKVVLEESIANSSLEQKAEFENKLKTLITEEKEKVHLNKSAKFYELKKMYKKKARKTHDLEAVAMDFQKM